MMHDSPKSDLIASLWHGLFLSLYFHKAKSAEGRYERWLYTGASLFHLAATLEHLRCGFARSEGTAEIVEL